MKEISLLISPEVKAAYFNDYIACAIEELKFCFPELTPVHAPIGMLQFLNISVEEKHMEKISKRWGDKTVNKIAKVVDGNRVLQLTGLRPSKLVGDIVRGVTDHVINNNVKSDKEIDKLIMKFYEKLK